MKYFILDDEQQRKYECFLKKHEHSTSPIGGHISVKFTITSIADFPIVKCSVCNEELDISNYDNL